MTELDELLQRGRTGDRSALSLLIGRHQDAIAGFVAAQLRAEGGSGGGSEGAAQCEDLCQAVFVKMVLGLPRLRESAAFEPWLFQIARNVCRDHLRRQRWRRRLFEPFQDRHAKVAALVPVGTEAQSAALERAIARLDAKEQTLLSLTLERPRSYVELAGLLGISVSATKSRLFRTRERLGALLKEGGLSDEN